MKSPLLWRIDTGNACFGVVTDPGGTVVRTAPIGRQLLGLPLSRMFITCRDRHWKVICLDHPPTRVVHCRAGPHLHDVYIGRPSKWGNPYHIGAHRDGTRAEVIAKYRAYLLGCPDLLNVLASELRGKVLGCWCAPAPCHGDVLAELADDLA